MILYKRKKKVVVCVCCFLFFFVFVFYQKEVVLTLDLATNNSRLNTGDGFCGWLVQKASHLSLSHA